MNIAELQARLAALDTDTIARTALAGQGGLLADQIRTALATAPGGPHDHPWRQTGALHDSIGTAAEGDTAIVGSTSAVALYQEHGTAELPPRPTFAPLAASQGEAIAHAVATAAAQSLADALRRR